MSEHLTDTQIEAFRHSRLDGAQLLRVSDHLAACDLCRERSIQKDVLTRKIVRLQEEFQRHLTDEELMLWTDRGPIDEPGFVEAHLERCPSCREELAELRALQAQLRPQARPGKSFNWLALVAALIVAVVLILGREQSVPIAPSVASRAPAPAVPAPATIERPPILDELFRPEGRLLGNAPQVPLRALSPVGIVTSSDLPVFRWEAVPGAAEYVVSVYDGNFRRVAESPKLATNRWEPATPLPRGVALSWQVVARVGEKEEIIPSPPAREAVFQVMNAETAQEIERARNVDHASSTVLGLLYARAGALEDAEAEFRKVPEAKELMESLQKLLQQQR